MPMLEPTYAETFKIQDASSYDPVAESFDRFARRFSTPLAVKMVQMVRPAPSDRLLDVGTGTGVVALAAARALGPEGRVLGLDLSDGMLKVAEGNAAREGLAGKVTFLKADAETLDLPPRSFDAALSLFTLYHLPNPAAALRQIHHVLRPGGKLVIAVGSGPPLLSMTGLLHRLGRMPELLQQVRGRWLTATAFLDRLVARSLPAGPQPETPGRAAHYPGRLPSPQALVGAAGFTGVQLAWQGYRVFVDTPDEFWDLQRTYSTFARKRLSLAPAEEVAALRKSFMDTCRAVQARGGRLAYRYAASFVSARRTES